MQCIKANVPSSGESQHQHAHGRLCQLDSRAQGLGDSESQLSWFGVRQTSTLEASPAKLRSFSVCKSEPPAAENHLARAFGLEWSTQGPHLAHDGSGGRMHKENKLQGHFIASSKGLLTWPKCLLFLSVYHFYQKSIYNSSRCRLVWLSG